MELVLSRLLFHYLFWYCNPFEVAKEWSRLEFYYSKKEYHNISHIERVCKSLSKLKVDNVTYLAALLHDLDECGKDPYQYYEDLQKVLLNKPWKRRMFEFFVNNDTQKFKDLLAVTKTHVGDTRDQKALSDSDLLIFSSPDYNEYSQKIRKEYSLVDRLTFLNGRIKILESFLQRSNIYLLPENGCYEYAARENLKKEISELKRILSIYESMGPINFLQTAYTEKK